MIDAEDLLRDARAQLEVAEAQVRRLRAFVETCQEMVTQRKLSALPKKVSPDLPPIPQKANGQEPDDAAFVDRLRRRGAETEFHAVQVIKEAGHAVTTKDMLAELQRRGLKIGGKNPRATLLTRLSRASSLKNIPAEGWVIEEPAEPNKEKPPAFRAGSFN